MNERDRALLQTMLQSVEIIERHMQGVSDDAFLASLEKQDAVSLRLGVIGEAAGKVSAELKARHSEIDWRAMYGLRNRIMHDYLGVDFGIVLDTIRVDVPELKERLKAVLKGSE